MLRPSETLRAVTSVPSANHLEQAAPDAIISDIAMPTQDGIDLVRKVRALDSATSKVPMVALTAFTSDDDRRRILARRLRTYLAKPVAPLVLMRVLANLRDEGASPSTIM